MPNIIALYKGYAESQHLLRIENPLDYSIMITGLLRKDLMKRNILNNVYAIKTPIEILLNDILNENGAVVIYSNKYVYIQGTYYTRYLKNKDSICTLIIPILKYHELQRYVNDVLSKSVPYTLQDVKADTWSDGVHQFNRTTGIFTKEHNVHDVPKTRSVHTQFITSSKEVLEAANRKYEAYDPDVYLSGIMLIGRCLGYTISVSKYREPVCYCCGRPGQGFGYSKRLRKFVTLCDAMRCRQDVLFDTAHPTLANTTGFVGINKRMITTLLNEVFTGGRHLVHKSENLLHLISDDEEATHTLYNKNTHTLYTEADVIMSLVNQLSTCRTATEATALLEEKIAEFHSYPVLFEKYGVFRAANYVIEITNGKIVQDKYYRLKDSRTMTRTELYQELSRLNYDEERFQYVLRALGYNVNIFEYVTPERTLSELSTWVANIEKRISS